jgi:hypothetical protein
MSKVVMTGEEVEIYSGLPFGEAPQGSPHTAQSSEGTPGQFYRLRLAERTRDQTLEECAGCGRVTGESDQPLGGGVAAWEIALCVDA